MTTNYQLSTTNYVLGTAGHVDHGKSLLVEALTGIDPDRLREEKTRGMTIDLGFAWLTLPGGRVVSIVDVPGHERFIKNMLAGAGGIDLALLVVAADDGVMPQTREHLAILDLLDVQRGVVAITKRDLADADWLPLVISDVRELLTGSTLEGSPIVACSSVTREGLDELLTTIEAAIEDMPPKRDIGRPRLPVDRVFTMSGFGTVVTGTLIDGELRVGEEVEAMPGGLRGRIRGLQSHRDSVGRAMPGTRTAVNITGIAKEDLRRGTVLARPESLRATTSIDVRLRAVEGMPRPVRHNLAVTFHSGADEANAQVRLLEADDLRPGDSAWAQIKLDTPISVLAGDRFVLRTANDTVAGGVIAAIDAKRHRRRDPKVAPALQALLSESPADRVVDLVARRPLIVVSAIADELRLSIDTAEDLVRGVEANGVAIRLEGRIVTAAYVAQLTARAHELLRRHHADHPLRPGMPADEFRSRLALDARAYSALMPVLPEVRLSGSTVALGDFSPAPAADQQAAIDGYLSALRATPASPAGPSIDPDLLAYLIDSGAVVDAGDGIVYEAAAFAEMAQRVREHIERHRTITLAQARDLFGTSRKYAQALLEHLDRTRVTRRVGDERVLRRSQIAQAWEQHDESAP